MIILGIETSCDETATAVLANDDKRITILSNVVASSANLQSKYGGIIPEQAAREQLKSIIPVVETAINDSRLTINDIDAIAVTYGPGLIGSLLVGVETAKILAIVWDKPLIPINHLIGHFYANWIVPSSLRGATATKQSIKKIATGPSDPRNDNFEVPSFPCLGLLVSGGHTDLVLFTNHGKHQYLGGTRDDAAGECFDKCARLLGLPYPGGPEISKLATKGDAFKFNLPRPMIDSDDFDFSFSGLKTAVANLIRDRRVAIAPRDDVIASEAKQSLSDLAASIEQAIVDVLVTKVIKAAKVYEVEQIMVAGGVAANQELVRQLKVQSAKLKVKLHIPPANLCTDNAAMIASAAFFQKPIKNPLNLQADPNLSL